MKRWAGRCLAAASLATLAGVLIQMAGCAVFAGPDSDRRIARRVGAASGYRSCSAVAAGRSIHWVETGRTGAPAVIFVHGSPGSWSAFERYLEDPELAARFRLISVDRPGFGRSGLGRAMPSLRRQAEALAAVWRDWEEGRRALLVGHSLGGPVAARMAARAPERVAGLLLLAPSVDPALENVRWYQHFGHVPPFRWLLPLDIRATNDEIYPLRRELERLAPEWRRIDAPVIALHGADDNLVPAGNLRFLRERLPSADLRRLEDQNHFLVWNRYEAVKGALLALAERAGR